MIHTLSLLFKIKNSENLCFLNRIKYGDLKNHFSFCEKNWEKDNQITYSASYPPASVFYNYTFSYITVTIDPSIILNHRPIADDYEAIEEYCSKFIRDTLGVADQYVERFNLNRIDYNIDYRIKSDEERDIIYFLMQKCRKDLYSVTKLSYDTAITYIPTNGWVEVITYDKEAEEKEKYKYKNKNELQYVGIFRTEVRIKNSKLNYNKNVRLGVTKDLCNYLCEDMKKMFWELYAEKVWFTEDFYRLDKAIEIVRNSNLKKNMQEKLCKLLKKINKTGYTQAQRSYKCKDTFRNHIKIIRSLNVNPLTFSNNFNLEKIENFARYKGVE